MDELEGVVEDIRFKSEESGFTVFDIDAGEVLITCTGTLSYISVGDNVRLKGRWKVHPVYGEQFNIEWCEVEKPSTLDAIEKYLASGMIKGIKEVTAHRIVEHFGEDTLDVLDNHPERLIEIEGIGETRARVITESYLSQKGIREVMIFLQGLGVTPGQAMRIYKTYGLETTARVKANPYDLTYKVYGIGFATADKMALNMGFASDSKERIEAGTYYCLQEAANNGDTYLPEEILLEYAARLLNTDEDRIKEAIASLTINNYLAMDNIDGVRAVYLKPFYTAENNVVKRLMELSSVEFKELNSLIDEDLEEIQENMGLAFAEEQKRAICSALGKGILILTGGPGTGKTTTLKGIISMFEKNGIKTYLAAPTGRAAKRMSEATGIEAKTIHRLLEYNGIEFKRDEEQRLECDAIIIDEASMIDIILMNNLLRAINPGTRLVIAGDVDQLPSVGAGNVLRDIIDSGLFEVVRLNQIFRQASLSNIIVNAHRINQGLYPFLDNSSSDFYFIREKEQARILELIKDVVMRRLPEAYNLSPADIQVLSPMKKGTLGTHNLNAVLQELINPPSQVKKEIKLKDRTFREGDRVMQIRNDYNKEWESIDESGMGVYNGDIGIIRSIDIESNTITVDYDGRKTIYDISDLEELALAYAITVHKSQGSEFNTVVMPMSYGAPMLMTRNLLYTAITRAKERVVLIGDEQRMYMMIKNNRIEERYSGLKWRLQRLKDYLI
ncbi:MAG: ATP-dependent RecD-like DNA helicase [Thermoanaerobacteraceae bacterium]|nr:ATP-dependent RecD-like DNA helicase [Thermoanaerobacteraceae bacterium]